MRIRLCAFTLFFCASIHCGWSQSFEGDFVDAINRVRSEGCDCGGEWLRPVGTVKYNDVLSKSARHHAYDISRQKRLNHYSQRGLNIGQRVKRAGYHWEVVGENLAFGHESIDEVIRAWEDSESHCRLIMDERFQDVGFAKLDKYWVLHFGTPK